MFNSITKTLVGLTLITMNLEVNGQMAYNIRPYANLYRNNYSMSNCSVLPVSYLLTSTECSNLTMVGSYSHCCHHLLQSYNRTSNFDICYPESYTNYSDMDYYDSHNYTNSLSYLYSCSIAYNEVKYIAAESMVVIGIIAVSLLVLFLMYRICRCLCCRNREYSELN